MHQGCGRVARNEARTRVCFVRVPRHPVPIQARRAAAKVATPNEMQNAEKARRALASLSVPCPRRSRGTCLAHISPGGAESQLPRGRPSQQAPGCRPPHAISVAVLETHASAASKLARLRRAVAGARRRRGGGPQPCGVRRELWPRGEVKRAQVELAGVVRRLSRTRAGATVG
jgi:hypothetical protein